MNTPVVHAEPVTATRSVLGEGIRWDAGRGELLWVDITEGVLRREQPAADGSLREVGVVHIDRPLGAVAPMRDGSGWVAAAGAGFVHLALDGTLTELATPADPARVRMNDGACDPAGRFWAGTVGHDAAPGAAALYRLDPDGTVRTMVEDLTISNGVGWSPDGRTMYLVDSGSRVVWAFDYAVEEATIGDRRVVVELHEDLGAPDGLTVDDDGALWVAVYGAGRVQRRTPGGELLAEVLVEPPQTTSCWFGGARRDRLFVTTATEHYDDARRAAEPLAGRVFGAVPGATGPAATPFAGAAPARG